MNASNSNPVYGKRMLAALKLAVKEAWVVMSLMPDKDARFRMGLRGAWTLPVVHGWDAYDPNRQYNESWLRRSISPRDISIAEAVMIWMVWLRQTEGKAAVMRIIGWSMGATWLNLASREKCSDRTVQNRVDRSLNAILNEFVITPVESLDPALREFRGLAQMDIESIDEPELSNRRGRWDGEDCVGSRVVVQNEFAEIEPEVYAGKVYIAGIGFLHKGVRYRSALD